MDIWLRQHPICNLMRRLLFLFTQRENLCSFVSETEDRPYFEVEKSKEYSREPKVCFLVHHYDEDWTKPWFVMITGYATLVNTTSETLKAKLKTIHNKFLNKYSQYNRIRIGNFYIRIKIDKTAYWNYTQLKNLR